MLRLTLIILLATLWLRSLEGKVTHSLQRVRRHLDGNQRRRARRDLPFAKLEKQEIEEGAKDASHGDSATLHGESDTAAHKFSLSAEKLEVAASNDAGAQAGGETEATARQKDEHELAERLENLAQGERRVSAEAAVTKEDDPDRGERETKEKKASKKKEKEQAEEGWTLGPEPGEEGKGEAEEEPKEEKDWVSGDKEEETK